MEIRYIIGVSYDDSRNHITELDREYNSDCARVSRKEVVDEIFRGIPYRTKLGNSTAKITIYDEKYLTTEGNFTKRDNLGELPEF